MASVSRRIIDWAAAFEDGAIIRAAFFGLLTATGVILYLDYTELNARQPFAAAPDLSPILPAFDPTAPAGKPGPDVTTPMQTLRQPLTVQLVGGGVLQLTGTFDPGSADRSPPRSPRTASTSRPWRWTRPVVPSPKRSPSGR